MRLERLCDVDGGKECIQGRSVLSTFHSRPIISYCGFHRWVFFCCWMFLPSKKVFRWLEKRRNRWACLVCRIRSILSHHFRGVARYRSGRRCVRSPWALGEFFTLCLVNSIPCCRRSSLGNSFLNSKNEKRDYYWWTISLITITIMQNAIE